jgi:hypothetical protein
MYNVMYSINFIRRYIGSCFFTVIQESGMVVCTGTAHRVRDYVFCLSDEIKDYFSRKFEGSPLAFTLESPSVARDHEWLPVSVPVPHQSRA